MAYSIEAIKAKLSKTNSNNSGGGGGTKLTYFKPVIGEHEVRFLPYQDSQGNPLQSVLFYNKLTKFGERRMISPATFNMPDPIAVLFEKIRKGKENWPIAKNLRPQERVFAVLIDRADEAKGPQVWEISAELRDKLYGILTHKDNVDEDMFSPDTGYDFTLTVVQKTDTNGKPQTFNGKAVKDYTLTARKKPSKLHKDPKKSAEWVQGVPKLEEYFKAQLMTGEEMEEKCNAFIASLAAGTPPAEGTSAHDEHGTDESEADKAAEDKVNDAFKELG